MSEKSNVTVLNVRWKGAYMMACDVLCNDRKISNIQVEASPPYKDAEVFLPFGIELKSDQDSKIVTAVLSYYYGIDDSN
jgi:hypothetical protein